MVRWHHFLRVSSTAMILAALTAASSKAQAPAGSRTPPERSAHAAALIRRGTVEHSGDPVALRKKRVAAARKALADLDRRIAVEAPTAVAASPSTGRTSAHLVASSHPLAPRPNLHAPVSRTPVQSDHAVSSPRRETAVVRAGVTMTRPSIPMPYTRSQGAGVSRAVMPPPSTRSTPTSYRTPPLPSRSLPTPVAAGSYSQP